MSDARPHADVIVIGAGLAGLAACLELLDRGRSVLLMDRDSKDRCGGLARESFGGIFVVGSPQQRRAGIRDTPELALSDWLATADLNADDLWPRRWAESYVNRCHDEVYRWLRGLGVAFLPVVHWVERGLFAPGNSVPRFHMVWGTGARLVERVLTRLETHPNRARLEIHHGWRVRELMTQNGRVTGCAGDDEDQGGTFEAIAGAVIVASGGICGDLERVRQHWYRPWGEPPAVILNGAHRFGDGAMHDRVQALGGAITHLDLQWHYAAGVHHPDPDRPHHGLSLVPPKSALWVNALGERIGPVPLITAFDTRYLVERVSQQPGAFSWQILNRRIAEKELAVSGSEYNDAIRDRRPLAFLASLLLGNRALVDRLTSTCEDFVVASSLPELFGRIGPLNRGFVMDEATLTTELERWDAAIRRGRTYHNDDQLRRIAHTRQYRGDRIRTCRAQPILDAKAGPLIAIREHVLARKSLGGILTDLEGRVLTPGGHPVSGLYAAGEAAGFGGGGIHGKGSLEGTFLGTCILTGRSAARAIATG